jgi:hypothetical protein
LTVEFGQGFSEKNLWRMVQFAEVFSKEQIVATLSRQLGWSHFKEIISLDDDLKSDFYAEMCRIERWSVRTLRQKISGIVQAVYWIYLDNTYSTTCTCQTSNVMLYLALNNMFQEVRYVAHKSFGRYPLCYRSQA